MALKVFLAATLRKYIPGYDGAVGHDLEIPPGSTVADAARLLGIPEGDVKLIMVNGIGSRWETVLQGDERLGLFPPVGGG
jgi:sulfur carrier protein ThiS